jgi:hypothetical protein
MSKARQNVDKLNAIVSVTQYGARGDGVTDDTAAIQAAIDAAFAAGGGNVWIPEGTYCVSSSIALKSNVGIIGEQNASTLYATGSASITGLLGATTAYSFAATSTLASNALQNAITLVMTSAASVSVGDVISLEVTKAVSGGTEFYRWMTQVVGKSSNTLTIADPMPVTINTSETYSITRLAVKGIENCTISNLRFDKGTNTGSATYGVAIYGGVNVDLSNLSFVNLGSSSRAGINLYYCLHVWLSDIFTERCGSLATAAQNYSSSTGIRADNLRCYDDDGFGILFQSCAYTQATQLSCIRATDAVGGRGIKMALDLRGQYSNIISNNNAYTGVGVSNASIETQLSNLILIGNGWNPIGPNDGLNIFGNASNVRVSNVMAYGNQNQDIAIQPTAVNTYIDNVSATNVADSGTGSVITRAGILKFPNTWTGAQAFINPTFTYTSISDTANNGQTGLQVVNKNSGGTTRNNYLYASGDHFWLQADVDIVFSPGAAEKGRLYSNGSMVLGSATGGAQGVGTLNAQAVYDDGVLLTCYVLEAWIDGAVDVNFWDGLVPDRHIAAVITGQETGNPVEIEPARIETRRHERARGFAGVATDRLNIDKFAQFLRTNKRLPAFPGPEQWQDLYAGKMATGDLLQRIWETCEVLAVHLVEARERELALEARITALES